MLKNIPAILSPDLLKIMMEMGHGDEIVLADGNFPSAAMAQRLIRLDGHGVPPVLDAVLKFFPLDTYVEAPVAYMAVVPGDDYVPQIKSKYNNIIDYHYPRPYIKIEEVDRFAFYQRAKEAYAIVATGETAKYANIILKKGVVVPE
ncbi:MAG: L-fucose mutarotase [Defluviitaleaceae bacterium]|nr:L-fucose mutarotase [Defluviitaleaceae bacterium]